MHTPIVRRAALALLVAGCATPGPPADRVIDVGSGRSLARNELLALLRQADVVLLGEQHDNPHHHRRRGALLAELGPRAVVVAEHLSRGARVAPGADLRARLEAAGFDAAAWGWPLYRDLFGPPLAAGLPVLGGNAPRDLARQVARSGPSAWPAELRPMLEAAPLPASAQAALDQGLLDGHCGQLPAARVPAMRASQRVRDASMAQALLDALAAGARPAVLVAGNGHVRTDHGVPQLLHGVQPALRVVSVGLGEPGWAAAGAPYALLWLTPAVARQDPCAGFRMPAPAASTPTR